MLQDGDAVMGGVVFHVQAGLTIATFSLHLGTRFVMFDQFFDCSELLGRLTWFPTFQKTHDDKTYALSMFESSIVVENRASLGPLECQLQQLLVLNLAQFVAHVLFFATGTIFI